VSVEPAPEDRRTTVKVCGLTRVEDARAAVAAGADWLGFVLWEGSPRQVDPGLAAEIVVSLPSAHAVAVMVSPRPDEAHALATRIGARRVQLHRVDAAAWPGDFPLPVAFAVPVDGEGRPLAPLPANGLLFLDRAHEHKVGGTGETFPWDPIAALAARRALMLAGGLDHANVADALERVRPWGVDAASRLETVPGVKDRERVRRFVAAVRAWDARQRAAS
jgi:phosphoribosylanthranilate isomerase